MWNGIDACRVVHVDQVRQSGQEPQKSSPNSRCDLVGNVARVARESNDLPHEILLALAKMIVHHLQMVFDNF